MIDAGEGHQKPEKKQTDAELGQRVLKLDKLAA